MHSIKARLILLCLMTVTIGVTLVAKVAFNVSRAALEKTVAEAMDAFSQNASTKIFEMNEKEFMFLHLIAEQPFMRDETLSLEEKNKKIVSMIEVDSKKYENVAFYDKSEKTYFTEAMAGRNYVGEPVFSNVTNQVLMFFSVPVYNYQNKIIGAAVSVIKGNKLSDIASKIDAGGGYHPYIISMDSGNVIGSSGIEDFSDLSTKNPSFYQVIQKARKGNKGSTVYKDSVTGKKMICCFRPIENSRWVVLCSVPYKFYFSSLNHLRIIIIITNVSFSLFILIISRILIRIFLKPLLSVKNSITEIANGNADLTKHIDVKTKDEIGDVVVGFNKFVEKLHNIISDIKVSKSSLENVGNTLSSSANDTAKGITLVINNIQDMDTKISSQNESVEQTASAVNQISSNIESLGKMIENASSGVQEASAAVEQMIGNIASVNASVEKMAHSFGTLEQNAIEGAQKQEIVNEKIRQIGGQSQMLQEANQVISNIAEQTNLLAMNAAIEASHAGEAGRGFSVVADEIRKLSETSTEQSKKISDQLNIILNSIEEVVTASGESSASFANVEKLISDTDVIVRQLREAMNEQYEGSKQIGEALNSMKDSTTEVRSAGVEMAEGNKSILEETKLLQETSEYLKQAMDKMTIEASKINEAGAVLDQVSELVKKAISDISLQIDAFKV